VSTANFIFVLIGTSLKLQRPFWQALNPVIDCSAFMSRQLHIKVKSTVIFVTSIPLLVSIEIHMNNIHGRIFS
jgi:hypothetical protein